MSDNPFNDAMDAQEAQQENEAEDQEPSFDVDQYYDALDAGPKEKTIGIAVNEEMHAFYQQLRDDEDVDIDVAQSIRDHIEKLAHRHERTFEKAMRKLEIEREY